MSSTSSESLVDDLNALLIALNLPLTLRSPTDLTPTLILALLESILQQRIPGISSDIRECRSHESRVSCMKLVLGMLQTDILAGYNQKELDLTNIDPERLARGGLEEVVHVGRVFCWIGKRVTAIEQHASRRGRTDGQAHVRHSSSSTITSMEKSYRSSKGSSSSPRRRAATESNTSVQDLSVSDLIPHLSSFEEPIPRVSKSTQRRTRYIPKATELGYNDSAESSFNLEAIELPPVRRQGLIGEVDEDAELESFENSRIYEQSSDFTLALDDASHARTIALLKQRAHLLYQLAKLQQGPSG